MDTAIDLFTAHGYHGTGIDRIAEEAKVSKKTMYHHFRSKEELILAVLRRRDEQFRGWLTRSIEKNAETPRDKLLALFDAHAEWFAEEKFRGCLFINAAAEFSGNSDSVHAVAADHKRIITSFIHGLAVAAGANRPEVLSDQISLLLEGAIVSALISDDDSWARKARDAAEVLIDNN